MAILNGNTAQWPKQQAERKLLIMVISATIVAILTGALLGFAIARGNSLLGLASMLAAGATAIIFPFALNKPLRQLGKQRIFHWRGAQTEALVAWIIKTDLDNSWHLFNSVKLQQNWDIDHVLVGPGGIFAISTKSQRGYFSLAQDGTLLLNNKPTDLAHQAAKQAADLHDRLQALMGADTPWVQSILAAPFAYTDLPEKSQTTWILHQENLADTLESEAKKNRLSGPQLQRALHSIQTLAQNAEKLYRRAPKELATVAK
jgi:hypothetical protein